MVWSVSPAWEAVELTLGDRLHLPVRGPRPYRFRSDNRGCSRTNAWRFSTFPLRRLPAFFSKASIVLEVNLKMGRDGAADGKIISSHRQQQLVNAFSPYTP